MQNPNNPYQQTPGPYNSPTPNPLPNGTVSLDVIGQAWKLVQPNIGIWIGATLVMFLISGIVGGIGGAVGKDSSFIRLIFQIISLAINSFLAGGMIRMSLRQIRTGQADFADLFSAGDVLMNLVIAGIIVSIITIIGFVLCIIPGLIATALFIGVNPLIVDQRLPFVEAISRSIDGTKAHIGTLLVLLIVLGLLNIGGALACFVGLFVTVPISYVAISLVYTSLFGGGASTAYVAPSPNAPIADPNR